MRKLKIALMLRCALTLSLFAFVCQTANAQVGICPNAAANRSLTHPAAETSYTVGEYDDCMQLVFLNTGAETVTMPVPGTAFFPAGFEVTLFAFGSGGITVAATTGTLVNNASSISRAAGTGAICMNDGTNWWCNP